MKHIKLFEQYTATDERNLTSDDELKLRELGLSQSKTVYFLSPLTVSEDFSKLYDSLTEMDPRQANDTLTEYGFDFGYQLEQYMESDRDDEACEDFFQSVWDELNTPRTIELEYSSIDLNELESAIVADFNSAELFQYFEGGGTGVSSIKAVGLSEDGEFKVRVQYEDVPSEGDIRIMKDWLTGQYSDGWGEGFEQRPVGGDRFNRRSTKPEYSVHAWNSEFDWYIKETY